jgi:hypothetical protein
VRSRYVARHCAWTTLSLVTRVLGEGGQSAAGLRAERGPTAGLWPPEPSAETPALTDVLLRDECDVLQAESAETAKIWLVT